MTVDNALIVNLDEVAPISEDVSEIPTACLRWNNGVLEQAIQVTRWRDGFFMGGMTEWRPIPIVQDAPKENEL